MCWGRAVVCGNCETYNDVQLEKVTLRADHHDIALGKMPQLTAAFIHNLRNLKPWKVAKETEECPV